MGNRLAHAIRSAERRLDTLFDPMYWRLLVPEIARFPNPTARRQAWRRALSNLGFLLPWCFFGSVTLGTSFYLLGRAAGSIPFFHIILKPAPFVMLAGWH